MQSKQTGSTQSMPTNPTGSTQSIQKEFQTVNMLLLKAMKDLSQMTDPKTQVLVEDLRGLVAAAELLQNWVSGHLQTDKTQLTALVDVGHMINSSLGLKAVLEGVMDALISLMRAESGFLMLKNGGGELTTQVARGMDRAALDTELIAVSRTIVQRVMASGEPVLTTNAQEDPRFDTEASVITLQLRSILCAPLKLKNDIIGVIYVDNRVHTGIFHKGDLDLLTAFADQAAIAIHNARLFEGLQEANQDLEAANEELQTAYDATLKGWVRALDLRDKETKGHTQRVTTLTRILARKLGFEGESLAHITRGALLHDIGKMGIPDSILLKPGALTPEERERINQHPVLAYEMLNPIEFLRPAIDIPYCHHEKWDGTGYPRGLKGTQIPLMARIFSIIDVWDALVSDRPYRKAMPPARVQDYLRQHSGTDFDPRIVKVFLELDDLDKAIEQEQKQLPA